MANVNEVKKALHSCIDNESNCAGCVYREYKGGSCIDALMKDAFDVINQMAVVRCKDCKHWEDPSLPLYCSELLGDCTLHGECVERWEHDFCSYGERKEGE